MTYRFQFYLLALLILTAAGCSKWEEAPVVSQLNVVNAYPDAGTIGISIDNGAETTVDFGAATGYMQQQAGKRVLQAKVGGNSIATGELYLTENRNYSLYLLKSTTNSDSAFVRIDTLPAEEVGRAKIRFANLSANGGALRLIVRGPATDTLPARAFASISPFATVDASQGYSLSLLKGTEVLATVAAQPLESERTYTIMAVGYATPPPGNSRGLAIRIIENRLPQQ